MIGLIGAPSLGTIVSSVSPEASLYNGLWGWGSSIIDRRPLFRRPLRPLRTIRLLGASGAAINSS